ncbi:protein phosphatase regulator [Cryptosporidium ryanae]|uniref:protein phosphatase regulator n=1 Tax=Cryptosporidium ryanae TaxID=515981 RepID=UPI003519E1B3|nr:protein phosphatase regulator [Cryptosporidium ryanae]
METDFISENKKKIQYKISEITSFNKSIESFIDSKDPDKLKEIIDTCLNSATIVKNTEGQNFISKLIAKIAIEIHEYLMEKIKTLILKVNTNLLTAYGKILYLVWNEYKIKNMNEQIQDFEMKIQEIYCLGSIKLNPVLAVRIRFLLHYFHDNRDQVEINSLLVRLYDPIIWRYLSVANWKVRLNSTALFAILFPLIDSSLGPREYKMELDRQYQIFQNLLTDNSSEVRTAAVQSVCRILTLYWEITPIEKIHELLDIMTSKCINDKSSQGVRIAVINGIDVILNNPFSQTILSKYLPKVCVHLHDIDTEVRYHVALLILKISRIEGMDYSKIISKKQILSRISKEYIIYQIKQSSFYVKNGYYHNYTSDSNGDNPHLISERDSVFETLQVARILSELLSQSIFTEKTLKEQIKYCHYFCDQCPIGIVGFFSSLKVRIDEGIGKEISDSDLLKLAVSLIKTTILSYKKAKLNYEKSKVLLTSCKEILEAIFYYRRCPNSSGADSINSANSNDDRIGMGIKFFVNNCADELVSKVDPDDRLWTSVIHLFSNQFDSFGKHYPKLSSGIVSELWRIMISQLREDLPHSGQLNVKLNVIVPLSIKWGLISDKLSIIVSGVEHFLSGNLGKISLNGIFASKDIKLESQEAGLFCLFSLQSILKFKESRDYFRGNKSLELLIGNLGRRIIEFYCKDSGEIQANAVVLQKFKELFIFIVNSIGDAEEFGDILAIAMESVAAINNKDSPLELLISHFELLATLMVFVTPSSVENKELTERIPGFEKQVLELVEKLIDLCGDNEQNKKRIQQGIHTYIFGMKRMIGNSSIESRKITEKLRLESEKPV